nr:hypothetical protein [Burkholderia ubonensis]
MEDDQVFRRRGRRDGTRPAVRELEVVVRAFAPEHHAVETVVVLKPGEYREPERIAIHALGCGEMADGAGNAQMGMHERG